MIDMPLACCWPKGKPRPYHKTRWADLPTRLWSDISKNENGCWIWLGRKWSNGYGMIARNGQRTTAHRAAFEVAFGPISDATLVVCHKCDVPLCINPEHLFLGTQADNIHDCIRKGRAFVHIPLTHCKHGHKLTPDTVYQSRPKTSRHRWKCKECTRRENAKYAEYRKAWRERRRNDKKRNDPAAR